MRPQAILIVTLALLAILAALPPLAEAAGSSWPCCNDCGICTRMNPPKCKCNDVSANGCHKECKKCVRTTLAAAADDDDGAVQKGTYRCADMLTNFCKRRCTTATAAAAGAFLGEVF